MRGEGVSVRPYLAVHSGLPAWEDIVRIIRVCSVMAGIAVSAQTVPTYQARVLITENVAAVASGNAQAGDAKGSLTFHRRFKPAKCRGDERRLSVIALL